MGNVIANASMSLDGFVAFEDDTIGDLFEWYDNGEVEIVTEGELPPFHVTPASADYWRSWVDSIGALVVGRELFDVTDGWHGKHPIGTPVVVLTHEPPLDWSYPGSEDFHFVTEGIVAAVTRAKEIAGDRDVALAAGTIAGQALDAGLVDEVAIDLVPVVMGSGKRYFGDAGPARLGDPTAVVQGRRVLHLRYPVERG
ncbi:dihydrofolate reductase [Agromyces sp. 3263]|uniref:dihydrofolate reductase family protein n=1 Tax=Agromyces sp. 3263 TaxID=2817750 RepID=UPI0028677D54|nr:dihydrofolate reductase family protein [Agromyces sp. 3263]MDR6906248.1 dihydrofolate reductase [Agromyces sp. 3263]